MPLNTVIFYGSVRSKRQGIKAARYIRNVCQQRGHQTTLVDPLEYPLPLLDRMYKEYPKGEAPEALEKIASLIHEADAFIVVCGEYNHSIPPALSNMLDHFLQEYFFRPAAIVSYSAGSFGGVRAAVQMRSMLGELGMVSIPSIFPVPRVQDAFDNEGHPNDESYDKRVKKFMDELEWYAGALREARKNGVPY